MQKRVFKNLFGVLAFAAVSLTCVSAVHAAAGDSSFNAEGSFVSGPDYADGSGSYDSGYGFGVGAGFEVLDNIEARAALNYHSWNLASATSGSVTSSVDLTNTQLSVGGRYNFPLGDSLKIYSGLGLTFNSFKVESTIKIGLTTLASGSSETDSKIGLEPGVGAAYALSDTLSLNIDTRYNLISDFSYFNVAVGLTLNMGQLF